MTESDRVEVPAAEAPSESAGQPTSRLDRFLARLRPAPEVPQDDAGEIHDNQDDGSEVHDDESVEHSHAFEHEPALPEGAPPYRDASDRPVHPEKLDVETVRQGRLGDCSLIASIDAMAHRDPARIASLVSVRENGDVVVSAGSGEPMSPSLPNIEEPSERWLNEAGDIYANSTDGSTLGPYIEKAYARDIGGYDKLDEGIWPKDALQYLSGRPAQAERTAGMPEARLGRVIGPECAAVAHAEERGDNDPLLSLAEQYDVVTEGPHAYAVRGIDAAGRVELHNPWGRQHPLPMPPQVFRQLFPVVSWCEVSKGEHGEG
jgi:hypothetical protein